MILKVEIEILIFSSIHLFFQKKLKFIIKEKEILKYIIKKIFILKFYPYTLDAFFSNYS